MTTREDLYKSNNKLLQEIIFILKKENADLLEENVRLRKEVKKLKG